jgi:hypothetical protein
VPSAFAWLDHDETDRRHMLELVNIWREKGTVDELGIGTIRDAFADHFFPGTSTIQTRVRYFLLVPWVYLRIERERVPSNQASARARRYQADLARALQAGGGTESGGVIGIQAGESLQRPPSVAYWVGLSRWGIRLFNGSLEQYHRALDGIYRLERSGLRSDDAEGELVEASLRTWHAGIPDPPDDLFTVATLSLSREEATYLQERIMLSAPGALLAWLAERLPAVRDYDAPWDLPYREALDPTLREEIEHARAFSLVILGATLLYNLMLAEKSVADGISTDTDRIEQFRGELAGWSDELRMDDGLRAWNPADFWTATRRIHPRLRQSTFLFASRWIDGALERHGRVADDANLRQLVAQRERALKGALARLHYRPPLERWSGRSGSGRLTYRWGQARTVIGDIRDGLNRA